MNSKINLKTAAKSGAFVVTESGTVRVIPSVLVQDENVKRDVARMRNIVLRHHQAAKEKQEHK